MNGDQTLALAIFALSYGLIITNLAHRTIAGILGAVLMGIFILTPEEFLRYQNWETLGFIFGMMVVIETLAASGFFRWLGLHAARAVRLDPLKLFLLFPFLAGLLAAFVDSITVMLFMATLTLEVSRLIRLNPFPLILAEITAANIGGAATMVGDPPNVILGTYFHLSFVDFVRNTGPIALLGFGLNALFFIWFYRAEIYPVRDRLMRDGGLASSLAGINPREAIKDRRLFFVGLVAFAYVVALLVTHHITGLSVATIAITGGLITLLLGGAVERMPKVLEKVDWSTLTFFGCLFLIVGGVEKVGLLELAADYVGGLAGGSFALALTLILWFAAIGSSVVDNVPFAATMAPMLRHLSEGFAFPLEPLIWATALGADIGGNGTPIGASANVVAIAAYERATGERVGWGSYLRSCYPAMLLVVALSNTLIYLRYVI